MVRGTVLLPTKIANAIMRRLSSIFYFGYLIAQYPAGYLLRRLPIGRMIGVTIIVWGILIITTPACNSFAGKPERYLQK